MGAFVGNVCYSTSAQALDAYYSAKAPDYTAGEVSYLAYPFKDGATWKIQRVSIAADGTETMLAAITAPDPGFPSCDPAESFIDGMTIGWMIAAAMIMAYAIRHLWESR